MYVMPTPLVKAATWYPDVDRATALYAESLDKVAMATKSVLYNVDKLYAYAKDSLTCGEVTGTGEEIFCVTIPQDKQIFDPTTTRTRLSIKEKLEKAVEYFKQEYGASCIIRDWLNYTEERKLLQTKIAELQDKLFSKHYSEVSALLDKDVVNIDSIFTNLCKEANK